MQAMKWIVGILAFALPLASLAQTYPSKPIRWILGYPPGGGTEFIARTVANTLSSQLGQPIVIENRPGAAAIVGAEAAARSAPDGYTLFMADNGTFVYHLGIYSKLPYDPNRDFIPVGMIVRGYMILLTHPELNAKSVQDLMSGRVALAFADLSAARGQIQSGKVRPIAVASKKRLGALPDVPTFEEAGFPDFEVFFWQGMAVPTGTPPEIVSRLSTELFKTMNTPEVQKRLSEAGMEVLPTSSDGMAEIIRKDQAFWVPLIKKLGIRVD